jgi:hypothetical protein
VGTKYILAGLACAFSIAGTVALAGGRVSRPLQSRTWLLIGVIFGLVSTWLFYVP